MTVARTAPKSCTTTRDPAHRLRLCLGKGSGEGARFLAGAE